MAETPTLDRTLTEVVDEQEAEEVTPTGTAARP